MPGVGGLGEDTPGRDRLVVGMGVEGDEGLGHPGMVARGRSDPAWT